MTGRELILNAYSTVREEVPFIGRGPGARWGHRQPCGVGAGGQHIALFPDGTLCNAGGEHVLDPSRLTDPTFHGVPPPAAVLVAGDVRGVGARLLAAALPGCADPGYGA